MYVTWAKVKMKVQPSRFSNLLCVRLQNDYSECMGNWLLVEKHRRTDGAEVFL